MASRKFRFVSPGVFLKEVDRSQLPAQADAIGPVIIGRTRKGPALRPYKVRSIAEFERVFGSTMPGNQGEDNWREGTGILAESYAPYAAKAYLSADINSPVTIVRLLGVSGEGAVAGTGEPGWDVGEAIGLFLMESGSVPVATGSLELAAVFYGKASSDFGVKLKGVHTSGANTKTDIVTHAQGQAVRFDSSDRLTVVLSSSAGTREVKFALDNIRDKFNTNPTTLNESISDANTSTLSHHYFLGETFEESYKRFNAKLSTGSKKKAAVAIPFASLMEDFRSLDHGALAARSGWIFSQDLGNSDSYLPESMDKLFRVVALDEGEYSSQSTIIGIEDIRVPRVGDTNEYGSFTIVVRGISAKKLVELERFEDCDLNPTSQNFVARRIGDQFSEWDPIKKRNRLYGSNPNVSEYVRIDVHPEISEKGPSPKTLVPFGFYGPLKQKLQNITPNGAGEITGAGWLKADTINVSGCTDVSSGNRRVHVKWPSMPIVHSGSASDGATGKMMFGASPFKQTYTNASASTPGRIIDPGYVDYLRRAPSYSTLASSQIAGLKGSNSEYSFTFSLDDVILRPTEGKTLSQIQDRGDIRQQGGAVYVSGSRNVGTAKAASAIITIGNSNSVDIGDTIVITSSNGTAITATVSSTTNTATDTNSPTFTLGNPLNSVTACQNLAAALNANSLLTAVAVGREVIVTQVATGTAGNKTITIGTTQTDDSRLKVKQQFQGGGNFGDSWSANADNNSGIQLRTLLDVVQGFHVPLIGGFDGVDILEPNPFNNRVLSATATTANNYAFASVDRAIELISDPEAVEHNLAVMPGITNENLTTKLVRACEARADTLAIIDLPKIYKPPFEQRCESFKDRVDGTTPEASAANLVARQINSSYGAAYYPWVKIRDDRYTKDVWVPPSVVALGVMAYTEQRDDVWFAPAGFNRGGLSEGNAGCTVLQASEQLLARDRDTLYGANINPVAQFVSEGLVIFGQKTLQSTPSALDRINVRRLLIFVKKEISRIANGILFEQNVQATWKKFTNQVVPFLDSVKVRFGLTDFKVVLDETTTTPDLIDRNILYAKVFLKPARSIEFIAVDFVITRTGAAYDD
jgi:hypothetical protein